MCKYIDNNFYTDKYSYEVLAVDGTDNNLRKSLKENGYKINKNDKAITAFNLGIYNVTRNYPVILEMVKHKNERKAFYESLCALALRRYSIDSSLQRFEKTQKLGQRFI